MVLAIQSKYTQSLSLENPQTSQIKASGPSFRSTLSTYYQPEVKKPTCWETFKIYAAKIWYYLSFQWLRDCCSGKTKREKLLSSMNSQISSFKETVEFEKKELENIQKAVDEMQRDLKENKKNYDDLEQQILKLEEEMPSLYQKLKKAQDKQAALLKERLQVMKEKKENLLASKPESTNTSSE